MVLPDGGGVIPGKVSILLYLFDNFSNVRTKQKKRLIADQGEKMALERKCKWFLENMHVDLFRH